jgi:uridine kinase
MTERRHDVLPQAEGSRQRRQVLERVATIVRQRATGDRPVLVAVDGVDGAGKTVFADELAATLESHTPVVRASVDGFHHPAAIRHRRGRGSPEGFFLDSYDDASLRRLLLDPLRSDGPYEIVRAIYDVALEERVDRPVETVAADTVLLFDGIFLHRAELRDYWDLSVFLHVPFEVSIPRGASRGYGDPDPAAPSNRRYVEGQRLYLDRCHPQRLATTVIDNSVLAEPVITADRGHPLG